ncbi:MAG TPA: N-acetylmuramoyl-L-alanine amidase [Vicinamibacterales bacterium]|nr:N-acetylmuramoyl-L-alanine amidase [Vicinamibacterales bacterium]
MGGIKSRPLHVRSNPFLIATAAVILIGLAAGVSTQQPPSPAPSAATLTLVSKEVRRTIPLTVVGDQEFVALDDLASAFQLQLQESLGSMTVGYKGKTILLTADQPLASVSGRMVSLSAAPTRRGTHWLVPMDFASRALGPIYDTKLDLRRAAHLLVMGDLRVPRVTVRYDPLGGAGRLTVESTPKVAATVTQDRDRLVVKFDADAIEATNPPFRATPAQAADSIVQAVRLADPTTLVIDLGRRFASYKTAEVSDRLIIDLAATGGAAPVATPTVPAPRPATPPPPPPPPGPIELPPLLAPAAASVRTIALDPGHGGEDQGVKTADGIFEKDLTLAVARRLKVTIEGRLGIRVLLTREDDRAVSLDQRTSIANNNKADLFVSIHANASMRRSLGGATIYSASFATAAARDAAAEESERVPTFAGGLRDIQLVPWDLAQTHHLDQSTMFAGMVLQQLTDRVPLAQVPVATAPLRVLASANMPAVLVEMGYLTNPEQERLLQSETFQSSLAQGLFEAIVRFRDAIAAGITR